MQIAGRASSGPPSRRGSSGSPHGQNILGGSPYATAYPRPKADAGPRSTPTGPGGMTIRRTATPLVAEEIVQPVPLAPFSMSIKSSASTVSSPVSDPASAQVAGQDIDAKLTPAGPAKLGPFPICNTAGTMAIRNTSPAIGQQSPIFPPAGLSPTPTPTQPFASGSAKRKREEADGDDAATAPPALATASKAPSLLSRLGIGATTAPRGQNPPARASSPATMIIQQTQQSPASKRRKSGGNAPQIPSGHPSLLDRMQGKSTHGSVQQKAVPSLLARMQPAGPANGSSSHQPVPPAQPRHFPPNQRAPANQIQHGSDDMFAPPSGPAVKADGVTRRGRGFANAGIALPQQNQGFSVKGRTNR